MKVTTIIAAFLPVLALAQSDASATTVTSTATQTMTVTLSRLHTETMTYAGNNTATIKATASTGGRTVASVTAAAPAATTSKPNAGTNLNAGNIAFAGIAGMIAAALL
ncbi:uncharacterized protein CTRU02_206921 [Colletotrichum truncatum]|uniref:Uncharacterized protein n=1 Tax=Colletotrichum truncatum TaxID=5467 RepID=A0ACC3YZ21_COLTU|nr:uncharacterized protein CTRU02_11223 [Colletotrichum truncatum]KAF6786352.1 hypothetical protein CTRU02_11223 [Colletotrichum truncatum]